MSRESILSQMFMVLAAAGCVSVSPSEAEPSTTKGEEAPASFECRLVFRAHVEPQGLRAMRLYVTAENVGTTPLRIELPDRCPTGLIDFEGLGAGYDYYRTCNVGACPGPRASIPFSLAPGEPQEIASTSIHLDGALPCAEPLAPGRHRVVPLPPALDVPVCVVGTSFELAPAEEPALPPPVTREDPPPRREPPPREPPRRNPVDPYSCEAPADCVLSCPSAPGCCGWPCGCRHAIHRDHREAFEASYAESCSRAPNCPAVACMHDPAIAATCRMGRCVGVSRLNEL